MVTTCRFSRPLTRRCVIAEIGQAFLSIIPSARGFGRTLENDVSRETNGVGKRVGSGFGKAFGAAAGVIAAAGIGSFLKGSIEEAREAQKVGAATEQIIKATGDAANLTAGQVGDLSGKLSAKIGVDDEVIQSGANLLLTFKNVREEVGKGNDIFTRATEAGADLAASGFGSIEGNAKLLGKALNDPLKGMTALSRAGVQLTDVQKEQIKKFVESGDLLSAQKVLLGEVEGQVKGVAEATATSGEKFSVAFGNLKEAVGTALLPVLENLFNKVLIPGITAVTDAFSEGGLGGVVELVRAKIVEALPVIRDTLMMWGKAFWEWLKDVVPPLLVQLGIVLTALGGWLLNVALPFLVDKLLQWGKAFVDWIVPLIPPMIERLGQLAGQLYGWIIDVGLPALITKLGEWGRALVDWIGPKIPPLLLELGRLIGELGIWILTVGLPKWYGFLLSLGKALIEWIAPQIPGLLQQLGDFIARGIAWVIGVGLPRLGDATVKWGKALIDWVIPRIPDAIEALAKFMGRLAAWVVTQGAPTLVVATGRLGVALVQWIAPQAAKATVELGQLMGRLTAWLLTQGLPALVKACLQMGNAAMEGLGRAFGDGISSAIKIVATLPGRVIAALAGLASIAFNAGAEMMRMLASGIQSAFTAPYNALKSAASKLAGLIPGSPVKEGPLKALNNGHSGGEMMKMLAKGIKDNEDKPFKAMTEAMQKVLDALKTKRDDIKGVLDGLKSDFAALSDSVSNAFTGNLFEATNRQDFITNLMGKRSELAGLKKAFGTLRGFGLDPAFLSQLFQSGNGALILELAASGRDDARGIANLFEDTQSLGASLGNQVAKADIGPDIRKQTKVLENIRDDIRDLDRRIGERINNAATAGRRGRVAA